MDVFFCGNRVTLRFSVAQFCKINDGGQALLKAYSLLWAHLPTTKYNTMNHSSLTCHVAAQTSLDQFTVCNFLFIKVQKEIIVVTGDLYSLLGILKNCPVLYMPFIAKRSLCYCS